MHNKLRQEKEEEEDDENNSREKCTKQNGVCV